MAARSVAEPDLFAVLFRLYVDDVHRCVWRRCRNDAVAEDLTAVTFEQAWRALPSFTPKRSTLRPWLLRIAANTVASHYRSEARLHRREQLVAVRDQPLRRLGAASDAWVIDIDDSGVLDALSLLTDRHQEVLTLRFIADLTSAETAEAMSVSKSHVAVIQHRALKALRAHLKGDPS